MSTIDFNSLARTASLSAAPLSLNSGLLAGGSPSPERSPGPMCGLPGAAGEQPPHQEQPVAPRETTAVPLANTPLSNAPLISVAQLHTEAERSRSAGLESAVARAVDRPSTPGPMQPSPSQAETKSASATNVPPGSAPACAPGIARHRVREVRREQGISIKRASQHLGVSVDEARRQEEPTCDLTLSQLHAWQKLCETPVADLLVEPDCELSAPVLQRARMVRVMKTVQAIMERTGQTSVKRLGQTLVNQLVELMPELKGVSSWHAVERRQSCNQNARILESNYLRPEEEETRE